MKKLMFAIGVFSFLLIGAVTIDTVNANNVYDDPPKKEVKSKSNCSDATKAKCCSGKTSAAKCGDKEGKSASTSTTTKDTKKSDPDKK
ncbi:MAG: hypothetical protein K8R74_07935 [Bacteroidales bacterium]|nr:hypothetical protein [Bacteroidales bacterium]